MIDILKRITEKKREEVAALKQRLSLEQVRALAARQPPTLDFTAALRGARPRGSGKRDGSVRIIAEVKRGSPSKGVFSWHGDAARQARAYKAGGARAISVVTDAPFFHGDTGMLEVVKQAVGGPGGVPVLQKDFLLEPWQVFYARALGADACLLIAACLPGQALAVMQQAARDAGLHTLVEVVDEAELEQATAAGSQVIGVNNRDLRTFQVDPHRTERLLAGYRDDQVCIAESGIHSPADVERMLAAGVDGFLIGEALMTAPDPTAHLNLLRGASVGSATENSETRSLSP